MHEILLLFLACLLQSVRSQEVLGLELTPDENILEWEPPEHIKKNYPYYFSGRHDGSAIWILPLGAWPIDTMTSDEEKLVSKHFDQALVRISESAQNSSGCLVIIDVESFSFFKSNFGFAFDKAKSVYKTISDSDLKRGWIVNANFLFDVTWKVIKLLISEELVKNIEVHDEDDNRWRATITNWIPKDKLPPRYGGYANYTPEINFGFVFLIQSCHYAAVRGVDSGLSRTFKMDTAILQVQFDKLRLKHNKSHATC
ncbi:unnamed protein product [Allacma fusca]|uniref:CRAL-TRIO domain-containing protein n=1 Tax=Allacma fusca TaxID=39272 RepID=A0A8J2NIL6_9HEXA|nr:unnamed protein product [Allacma fusca]